MTLSAIRPFPSSAAGEYPRGVPRCPPGQWRGEPAIYRQKTARGKKRQVGMCSGGAGVDGEGWCGLHNSLPTGGL